MIHTYKQTYIFIHTHTQTDTHTRTYANLWQIRVDHRPRAGRPN